MKIIKSGKKEEPENRTGKITCKCGCEFEWDESDIFTEPAPYVVATYPPCHDEFEMVKCPECNQKYRIGIKYGRPAEGYAIQAQDWIDAMGKNNDFSESKEDSLQHLIEASVLNKEDLEGVTKYEAHPLTIEDIKNTKVILNSNEKDSSEKPDLQQLIKKQLSETPACDRKELANKIIKIVECCSNS